MADQARMPNKIQFLSLLKQSRERFLDRHACADDFFSRFFSAATYVLSVATRNAMAVHCQGDVLDAGCGRGAWKASIVRAGGRYKSIDLAPRGGQNPTWTGDITSMPEVPDQCFDTIVCHQVLEHVRQPGSALREFHRTIRPEGKVILSAPHLSRRHELPNDYFRFTQEGLIALFESEGFETIEVKPYGGVLSFLHHQISTIIPGLVVSIPIVGALAVVLNSPISWILARLDPLLDRTSLMPLGVLIVARRSSTSVGQGVSAFDVG